MSQQNEQVDVVPYAKIEKKERYIIVQWEEPRDIFKVVVKCKSSLQSKTKLQYWQNHWPHQRIPKGSVVGAGRSGWMSQDDWFNGEWKDADTNVKVEGDSFIYIFNPINAKEFPDEDFDAVYRRTLKIRLLFEDSRPEIESIEAYTDSVWRETELKMEWGTEFAKQDWQGYFEVYNGELENIEALTDNVNVDESENFHCDDRSGSVKLKLRYSYNEDINSFDKTIVTLRSTARSFSFSIDDVESGKKVFIKNFDLLVTKAADEVDYVRFLKEWESDSPKTLYDRIKELPEQTLEKAWSDMPEKKSRGYMPLGCEGAIHLIRSEMLEPQSDESTWIIKDYEDNLYISERFGYSVDDFERDWFSLGGFSMQSNLLPHPVPYLWRDEPKHFLRGYFNAFASVFYPDICALVEHALPTLADNNGVWFKPSDEAQSAFWLRLMLISECEDELYLAMTTPREWLSDGKSIKIERAFTYFGEMGYEIHSEVENDKITMILEPPTRNAPKNINVRFRHPQQKPMKKVTVNGESWTDFDRKKELISLGKTTERVEIIALY